MQTPRLHFRKWWQIPRRAGDRPEDRRVTFLELFYDLVYVVIIAQLSHALSSHITWTGVGHFAFLFIIVWWAWLNGTTYHELHGNNDIRTRVFTFLQMLSVVAMAVFAHDAVGKSSVGFAISYAAFQLILTYLWWRTGVHDQDHRPLSTPYVSAFLISTFLFVGSVFIPMPDRFYLWGFAVLITLFLPLFIFNMGRKRPEVQAQIDIASRASPSLVERFGLFTIIVLGEIIVGVVSGVSHHHHLNWLIGGVAALGTLIAISLWWVYFDFISHKLPHPDIKKISFWYYLHIPLTLGITAVGATVLNVVEHAGEHLPPEAQWLLIASTGTTLLSIVLLIRTIKLSEEHRRIYRIGGRVMLISVVMIFLLGFLPIGVLPLLGLVVILLLAPVFSALKVWMGTIKMVATD